VRCRRRRLRYASATASPSAVHDRRRSRSMSAASSFTTGPLATYIGARGSQLAFGRTRKAHARAREGPHFACVLLRTEHEHAAGLVRVPGGLSGPLPSATSARRREARTGTARALLSSAVSAAPSSTSLLEAVQARALTAALGSERPAVGQPVGERRVAVGPSVRRSRPIQSWHTNS
jgi:hypothetical protein